MTEERKTAEIIPLITDGDRPEDRILQLNAAIRNFRHKGYTEVGLVSVLVGKNGEGTYYEPSWSKMNMETVLWATKVLEQRVLDSAEEKDR